MCFRFDAWCCFGAGPDHEDNYGSPTNGSLQPQYPAVPPKTTTTTTTHYPPASGGQRHGHTGVGAAAHHVNGHGAPHLRHHQQLRVAAAPDEEEDRKASNDARRGVHAPARAPGAAATKGALHCHAAGVPGKPYVYPEADGNPVANTVIHGAAGYGAHYYPYCEREPAHKEYYNYR